MVRTAQHFVLLAFVMLVYASGNGVHVCLLKSRKKRPVKNACWGVLTLMHAAIAHIARTRLHLYLTA